MATRTLSAAMLAALDAGTVYPAVLYQGEFVQPGPPQSDEVLRLWTGIGPLSWNGATWLGGGNLLGFSPVQEAREVRAISFSVSCSGIASADVQRALAAARQGKRGTLWLALFDASGALLEDPYQLQSGKLDFAVPQDDGETATIALQYESRLIDLERARERRYTSEDQQREYPGDRGFDQVPSLQDAEFIWPA